MANVQHAGNQQAQAQPQAQAPQEEKFTIKTAQEMLAPIVSMDEIAVNKGLGNIIAKQSQPNKESTPNEGCT